MNKKYLIIRESVLYKNVRKQDAQFSKIWNIMAHDEFHEMNSMELLYIKLLTHHKRQLRTTNIL